MKVSINIPLAVALGILLSACGGGGSASGGNYSSTTTDGSDSSNSSTGVGSGNTTTTGGATSGSGAATAAYTPNDGRLLAAQCFQCHGTDGGSVSGIEGIGGESASGLASELLEMKNSSVTDDIMHKQIRGYSDAQISAIATYLAGLPRNGD
ncbi:c-type cytochrome [Candidatus Thiothrix sp. Deng01]|uniref:C-type cytochrome n=1 Tax=Candidatus Thiothrix phosphatis TaxID=3112415 RepID=A0ABU6CW00_9GAMM|nr:c-type cytochrome [Candidatus Thiothrix sp. Deng01]MEB4591012.1 c-type cytochrome [Candidatus Thiothrix sp. Deng01]